MDDIFREKLLNLVKPSLEEHEENEKIVNKLVRKLRKSARKNDLKCDFFIGGSFGKGTYLKDSFDVDIFCRFNVNYDDSKLSVFLEGILSGSGLKYAKQKGSRDYFSLKFGNRKKKIVFEIIPNRKIKKVVDALNTTDISPFHVNFLRDKISENSFLADEIRIAKLYFKSKGLYGAESYINGFSGHTIDILLAYYGSFLGLLEGVKNWGERVFIDVNHIYKNEEEMIEKLGIDKISSLNLIDPTTPTRNASRALCVEKYSRLVFLANTLKVLNLDDFKVEKFDLNETIAITKNVSKENNLKSIIYKFKIKPDNESFDIVGAKMFKLMSKTQKFFESYDFKVFDREFFIDFDLGVCIFIFFFEKVNLPNVKKIEGPKVYMKIAVENFVKVKGHCFVEGDRVYSYENRHFRKIDELYNFSLEDFNKMADKDISFVKGLILMKF